MIGQGRNPIVHSDTVVSYVPRTDTLWHTIELTNNIPYTIWGHDTIVVASRESQGARIFYDSIPTAHRYLFISDTGVLRYIEAGK